MSQTDPAPLAGTAPSKADARALVRYRVMAYTTGVLLVILVFIAVPLQVWAGIPQMAQVVGTAHGFLFLVYLAIAFDFTRRLRIKLLLMLAVLLAGTVPFAAFVAERRLTDYCETRKKLTSLAGGEERSASKEGLGTLGPS